MFNSQSVQPTCMHIWARLPTLSLLIKCMCLSPLERSHLQLKFDEIVHRKCSGKTAERVKAKCNNDFTVTALSLCSRSRPANLHVNRLRSTRLMKRLLLTTTHEQGSGSSCGGRTWTPLSMKRVVWWNRRRVPHVAVYSDVYSFSAWAWERGCGVEEPGLCPYISC